MDTALPPIEPDKAGHLQAGYGIALFSQQAAEAALPQAHPVARVAVALIPVVVAALGKEVYDAQHRDRHTPDAADAVATVAGGLSAVVTIRMRW